MYGTKKRGVSYKGRLRPTRRAIKSKRTRIPPTIGGRRRRYGSYAMANIRTGGLLGIEKKCIDSARIAYALTAPTDATGGIVVPGSGITGCFTAPAQGDAFSNRDGNKIVIVELNCLMNLSVVAQTAQTACDTSCIIFIAMVQDTQTNGAAFTSDLVYTNPGANALTAASPFRNLSYLSRFKVLKTKRIDLRIPAVTWDGTDLDQGGMHTNIWMRWKGKMPVTFTTASTTADIANVTDNSINFVAFCTNTTLAPSLSINARCRFYG